MKVVVVVVFSIFSSIINAQNETVNWLKFEELEEALSLAPKKVFIHFYADWCVYCKKMEEAVYTKQAVINELEKQYYAVKFNVESRDSIAFGGKTFVNLNANAKRRTYHQIAELLAGQQNKAIVLPTIVFLDKDFTIEKRIFQYVPPKELLVLLQE